MDKILKSDKEKEKESNREHQDKSELNLNINNSNLNNKSEAVDEEYMTQQSKLIQDLSESMIQDRHFWDYLDHEFVQILLA